MKKNELKILITAGGTSEKIDSVRRITNSGTGALGALIAEAFIPEASAATQIVYICSEDAVRPRLDHNLKIMVAGDVAAVEAAIREACEYTKFDVIIHSMAISDYRVKGVGDSADLAKGVMKKPDIRTKISSDKDDLIVVLEKAPKLIAMFRGLAEGAIIVGFKLLSEVSEEELVSAGHALLVKNKCDFVFANDLKTVLSGRHEGFLIDPDGNYERAVSKEAIAALIVKSVLTKI
jgi:phosphopantothenate-cysteine ligase